MKVLQDLREFFRLWLEFCSRHLRFAFFGFEDFKTNFAALLYRQRGKFARPFIHSGMFALSAVGIMLGPVISEQFPQTASFDLGQGQVLSATTDSVQTIIADPNTRSSITDYTVLAGDTISSIADKFGVSQETIIWQNNLTKKSVLKPGQVLQILPITGIAHRVQKGDTIYSIAKKYNAEPQPIIDYPFNTFVNDETFALAVGQIIFVPDGTPPQIVPAPSRYAQITPNAGQVSATGNFVWPTSGRISQGFAWYHPAIDIANPAAPDVLAADSGTIIVAGWPDNGGYGNRVVIDHGNGYRTLYAHLQDIYVFAGQTVKRGDAIGKMGSTGRSTGTHVHFEIIENGVKENPFRFLR